MNYKPLLVIRAPSRFDGFEAFVDEMEDWHVIMINDSTVKGMTFEAIGVPDLDEITIEQLKKKLYIN